MCVPRPRRAGSGTRDGAVAGGVNRIIQGEQGEQVDGRGGQVGRGGRDGLNAQRSSSQQPATLSNLTVPPVLSVLLALATLPPCD
jgi:hypothetical protein